MKETESKIKMVCSYDSITKTKGKPLNRQLDVISKINQSTNTVFNLLEKTNEAFDIGGLSYEKNIFSAAQERHRTIMRSVYRKPTKISQEFSGRRLKDAMSLLHSIKAKKIVNSTKPKRGKHHKVKSVPQIPPIDSYTQSPYITSLSYVKNTDSHYPLLTQSNTNSNTVSNATTDTRQRSFNSSSKRKQNVLHNLHQSPNEAHTDLSPERNYYDLNRNYLHVLSEPNLTDIKRRPYKTVIANAQSMKKLIDQCSEQIHSGETLENHLGAYSKANQVDYDGTVHNVKAMSSLLEYQLEFHKDNIQQIKERMKEHVEAEDEQHDSKPIETVFARYDFTKDKARRAKEKANRQIIDDILYNSLRFEKRITAKAKMEQKRQRKELKEKEVGKGLSKEVFCLSLPKIKKDIFG